MVAVHLAAVVVVGALLLPFFGPALGYHYPERQPGQTYIFLSPGAPVHASSSETPPLSHFYHNADAPAKDDPRGNPLPDGVSLLLPFPGPTLEHHSHSYPEGDVPAIVALPIDAPPGDVPAPLPLSGSLLGHHPYRLHGTDAQAGGVIPGDAPAYCGSPTKYIVYLPFHDGALKSFRELSRPIIQVSLAFPGPGDGHLASGVPGDETLPQDAFIALPWRPPRA